MVAELFIVQYLKLFFIINLKINKMKKTMLLIAYASCVLLFASCKEYEKKETPAATTVTEPAKPDLAQIRLQLDQLIGRVVFWNLTLTRKTYAVLHF